RQALALAERRRPFAPCLWGGAHRDIRQVWFDGVHLDVGGGYENSYYSDRSLLWMVGEVSQRGRLRESVRPDVDVRPEDYDDYPGLRF
ncbi:phospholipase effector Tle1 domain-containing protein, partial [Mycobacterium kansasii]